MKAKKNPKVNLEKKKFLFFEIGLVLSLIICFTAFEWSTDESLKTTDLGQLTAEVSIFEEEILNTFIEEPPIEKVTEPELVIEEFKIVDDDKEVEKVNFDSEVKDKSTVKIIILDEPEIEEITPIDWVNVEQKPIFPGGDAALLKFISENITYPAISKENQMDGKVYVRFVISKTGNITDASIVKGVDQYLDAEALRVVRLIPKWEPGKQRGICVPVSFIIPIKFKLI